MRAIWYCSAAFPTTDRAVTFRNEVGSAPEFEIRKRLAKVRHEGLDVFAAATRLVQRVVQVHVGCRDLIDDAAVARAAKGQVEAHVAGQRVLAFAQRVDAVEVQARRTAPHDDVTVFKTHPAHTG
jgi:hypothetical protein